MGPTPLPARLQGRQSDVPDVPSRTSMFLHVMTYFYHNFLIKIGIKFIKDWGIGFHHRKIAKLN